jgi:antitoxin component HigA of HigAB toxin-antitoxin module
MNTLGNVMPIKPITTSLEHEKALERIVELMDKALTTEEEQELDRLSTRVADYEELKYPIEPPNVIDTISFRLSVIRVR